LDGRNDAGKVCPEHGNTWETLKDFCKRSDGKAADGHEQRPSSNDEESFWSKHSLIVVAGAIVVFILIGTIVSGCLIFCSAGRAAGSSVDQHKGIPAVVSGGGKGRVYGVRNQGSSGGSSVNQGGDAEVFGDGQGRV
jgi:hypothetical protein